MGRDPFERHSRRVLGREGAHTLRHLVAWHLAGFASGMEQPRAGGMSACRRPGGLLVRLIWVPLTCVGLVVGCASGGQSASGAGSDLASISQEELSELSNATVLAAVRRLRPRWLQARGSSSSSLGLPQVAVVLDGFNAGGANVLGQLMVTEVERIEYLSASDATTRYGTGFAGGAIVVTRRVR